MGLQSAMEALPEALLPEQRACFMEDLSEQHLWAYLLQPFCPMWQFLRLQVQWSHDNTTFSSKKYGPEWLRVTNPNPTQCDSHFLHLDRPRLRRPCTLLSGARVGWAHSSRSATCLHKTELERKRTRSILKALSFSKERMRKRDRERECVCVCVRASMTG